MVRATVSTVTAERDHRVDFYRGIALLMIFVNHIPGTAWENYTTRNFGFSDAAELFVFLAGFASAFAYGKGFLGGAPLVATLKAWRRAGVLYLAHIALTVICIALFAFAALVLGKGELMRHIEIGTILTRPLESMIGVAMLGLQIGYVNILPMYSVILLLAPALIALTRFGRGTMLAVSAALWVVSGIWRLDMPNYPGFGGWFFNPFAWQFIFAIGLSCGLAKWQRGYAVRYHPVAYAAALAYMAFAMVFVGFEMWGLEGRLGLPFLLGQFDKTYVTVPRLLHILAVVYVFAHMPKTSPLAAIRRGNPLAMIGRHSLPVFAVGTVLAVACQLLRYDRPVSLLRDSALIGAGIGIQVLLAAFLEWWREAEHAPSRPALKPVAAAAVALATAPPLPGTVPQVLAAAAAGGAGRGRHRQGAS